MHLLTKLMCESVGDTLYSPDFAPSDLLLPMETTNEDIIAAFLRSY